MRKQHFKFIGVVLLLLTIISQPLVAASLSCITMSADAGMAMKDSKTLNAIDGRTHSDLSTPAISNTYVSDSQEVSDCCEKLNCSMSHCFSLPAIVVATHLQITADFSGSAIPSYRAAYIGAELASLYRPPISR